MTYSRNSLVEAEDFNNLVGELVAATPNRLNTVLGVGYGSSGYGQTPVSKVVDNGLVTHVEWSELIDWTKILADHQGTSITAVTLPVANDKITYNSAVQSNIDAIYPRRFNAIAQGATPPPTNTTSTPNWQDKLTFTHTVSFESGDKARYFFNCGGQILINFSHPSGSGINQMWNDLATACGTIYISGTNSGDPEAIRIAGQNFSGVTKFGGSGTTETLRRSYGYYGLTTTNTEIFKQLATIGPKGNYYLGSAITVEVKTSAPTGSNGDNGDTITITTTWDEIPNGLPSSASTTTVTIKPPSANYISKTWGDVTVVGSVVGS